MKKILSFLIVLSLVFSQITPDLVSAQEGSNQSSKVSEISSQTGNGEVENSTVQDDKGKDDLNPFGSFDNSRKQGASLSLKSYQEKNNDVINRYNEQSISEKDLFSKEKDCYIVKFNDSTSLSDIYQCVSKFKYKLLADSSQRMFKVEISDLSSFKKTYSDITKYIENPVAVKLSAVTPNDPKFSNQWALPDMNLPAAWDTTKGSNTVKVGVIDSGLYRYHEDLQGSNFLTGFDVYNNTVGVTSDMVGHGTMVASVIGASTNNLKGVAGACWNVSIVPYKVADPYGDIYSDDVISAIMRAADEGCDVINMSFGCYVSDKATEDAINYAYSKGCIVVAASGNEGSSSNTYSGKYSYPASYNHVISAAAVNNTNTSSYFSQHNNQVDVCAPGESVLVASADGIAAYSQVNGTSFSSPYVAAVAALARSMDDGITQDYFEKLIKETSTDLGTSSYDNYYGWGLINAQKIVQAAEHPIVLGVQDNGIYTTAKTITFSSGTATLNGSSFASGTTISTSGNYTLDVTNSSNNKTTVHFTIDTTPLELVGIQNNASYNTDKSIVFNYGTATLNGTAINSGYVVSAEGSYNVVLTSPYGISVTYHFTIDKTKPIITGVENGKTYDGQVTISFNEGTALLNGNLIQSGYILRTNGDFTLVVTDAAGNTTTVIFTVINNTTTTTTVDCPQLSKWVMDPTNQYIYALSSDGKTLRYINTTTLYNDKSLSLSAAATDIMQSDGKIYLAIDSLKQIIVVDATSNTIDRTIQTTTDPNQLVKDGSVLYYTNQSGGYYIYSYNLDTGNEIKLDTGNYISQPQIAINATNHIIYLGEYGTSGSKLYYYSITDNKIIAKTTYDEGYGFYFPQKGIFYDGNYVFYAGRAFNPTDVTHMEGDYDGNNQIIYAKNKLAYTANSVFDEETHVKLGSFKTSISMILSSADNINLYTYQTVKLTRYTASKGTIDATSIINLVDGTYPAPIPSTVSATTVSEKEKALNMSSQLTKMVYNENNDKLYAISKQDKALFVINKSSLNIEKTMVLQSQPTDIIYNNNSLFIALDDAHQIIKVDVASGNITNKYYTKTDPNQLAVDGDNLFYSAFDMFCSVNKYNMTTGNETRLNISSVNDPGLAVDTTNHILYIGDTSLSGSDLNYYSITDNKVIGTSSYNNGYGYPYPDQGPIYDGNYVFYAGRAFDPKDVSHIEGDYDGKNKVMLAKNGLVYTANNIFNEETHTKVGSYKTPVSLITASSDNKSIYIYRSGKITCYTNNAGIINGDNVIGLIDGTKSTPIPTTVTSTVTSDSERTLPMTSELTKWVYDDNSGMLYAISKQDKAVFFIDKKTFGIKKTIILKSQPTDIISEGNSLFIAMDDANQIIEISMSSGEILNKYYTKSDPNQIVKEGNYLYYAERDQWCDVYRYDINTHAEKKVNTYLVYYPSLAINPDEHILYIGESGSTGCSLYYYDTANETMIGNTTDRQNYYNKTTLYDGTYVYYNGGVYDPDTPEMVQSLGNSDIILAKYGLIFTNTEVYSEEDLTMISELPDYYDLLELSDRYDFYTYSMADQRIVKEYGAPPEVSGVEDGRAYLNSVTITFDYGTALLDGKPFNSGDTVSEIGDHDLIVSSDDGNKTEVKFTIYEKQPEDDLAVVFKDDNLKQAMIDEDVDTNSDGVITRGEMRTMPKELYLSTCDIKDLTGIEYAVNLTTLDLYGNDIADITTLSGLSKLKELNLGENKISDITPLQSLVSLKVLNLEENSINNISTLAKLTELTSLDLSKTQITDITALEGLNKIGTEEGSLDLSYNNISDIHVLSVMKNLSALDLSHNKISDITVLGSLTNLSDLSLSYNGIVDISSLSKLKNMGNDFGWLDLSHNNITDITALSTLTNLYSLDLSGNQITSLSALSKLSKLEYLDMSGNHFKDLTPIKALDLSGLSVSDCNINDISTLKSMVNLYNLDLSKNSIIDITSLVYLKDLMTLNLCENMITDIGSIKNLELYTLDISKNYLNISAGSQTMNIINNLIANNDTDVTYAPQKDLSQAPSPVITISDYVKSPTNQNIVVTATTDQGTLNATTHTFTENGSFTFEATSSIGKKSSITVTITNIDKIAPEITVDSYNVALTNKDITVTASTNEGSINAKSHKFTENGSFEFVATDAAGNVTSTTVTITNIDKTPPVISVDPFTTQPTNKDIVVTASVNEGELNVTSYTFTKNGSFSFVATDAAGNVTTKTVTITNIDKTAPIITIKPYNTAPTYSSVTVNATVNEGSLNSTSHTFTTNGSFTFYATDVAGNMTYVTVSIINIYKGCTIKFDTQGGTTIAPKTVVQGSYMMPPVNPQRTGYRFDGWYTASKGGSLIPFPYSIQASTTLYAHWTSLLTTLIPSGVIGKVSNYNTVKLSWNTVTGANGYQIYRSTNKNGTYSLINTLNATTFANTSLVTGTTYFYKIRAYQKDGSITNYSAYSKIIEVKPTLTTPSSLKIAKASTKSAKISWVSVSGASGYELYFATSSTGTYKFASSLTSTHYTKAGLVKGKTYYFKVKAYRNVNGKKVYSSYSSVVKIKM